MTLRDSMHRDQQSKALLEQARGYAYEYADGAAERNVFPSKQALADLEQFVEDLPASSGDATAILKQLHEYGSPATTAQTGGRYFGFVNGGILPVSLATKWLSDFWDQNTALYAMSPVASKLEEICERWLKQLFGLPDSTVAGFVSGTSSAILCVWQQRAIDYYRTRVGTLISRGTMVRQHCVLLPAVISMAL